VFIDVQARAVKRFRPWAGVETLAGRGRGPGEVTAPGSLQRLPGDSVQLYDGALDRVTVFGPDGAFAYDVPVHPPAGRPPTRVLRFRDTLLVGLAPLPERRVLARSDAGDLGVTPYAVVLYDMDAAVLDTIATIPGYRDIRTGTTSMMPTYGLGGAFAVHDDVLLHGAGAAPSYRVMDAAGRTLRIHRLLAPRRPVDRDSLAALLAGDEEGL
ncbi:MAG: hypothetical protein GWN71_04515, partial [Gammaproteobacteria bacterium]|nr:hypothetical protein [Gemmatimonadota bacterium]NIU72859.1 hypothetical protein [Gammaproteobacteria bacterium]